MFKFSRTADTFFENLVNIFNPCMRSFADPVDSFRACGDVPADFLLKKSAALTADTVRAALAFMNLWGTLLVVYLIHMVDEFQHLAGIAPLVIIPGHQLYKPGIEHDTGLLIKDGSTGLSPMKSLDTRSSLV